MIHETGGPEVLRYEDVPDPQPEPGQVLVRVGAIGVNRYDVNQRAGGASGPFPLILGVDAAGIQEDSGDRVLVTGVPHSYAELIAAPTDNVWRLPAEVDDRTAAALGVPYRTAWWSVVDVGGLRAGQTLLVQGGSSATGQAAIDVGRSVGATVYATASEWKLDRLRATGAEVLAYDDPQVVELGANVVFDPIGGDTFARSVQALGRDGRLVTPGAVTSAQVSFDIWDLVGKRARIIGIGSAPAPRETVEKLIELAARGELRPAIDRELPLSDAAEAHRAMENREVFGKIILRP